MKSCTTEIYTLLDARQLSIKCCMNSLFGLTGITQDYAMLPCQYIAESITFMGRYTIQFAKTKIEEWYGKNTVKYIDSDSLFICFGEEVRNNLSGAFKKVKKQEPEKTRCSKLNRRTCIHGMFSYVKDSIIKEHRL